MTREGECETSSLWARGSPSNRGDEIGLYNGTTVLKGATGERRAVRCHVEGRWFVVGESRADFLEEGHLSCVGKGSSGTGNKGEERRWCTSDHRR